MGNRAYKIIIPVFILLLFFSFYSFITISFLPRILISFFSTSLVFLSILVFIKSIQNILKRDLRQIEYTVEKKSILTNKTVLFTFFILIILLSSIFELFSTTFWFTLFISLLLLFLVSWLFNIKKPLLIAFSFLYFFSLIFSAFLFTVWQIKIYDYSKLLDLRKSSLSDYSLVSAGEIDNNLYKNKKLKFLLKIPPDWKKEIPGLWDHFTSLKPGVSLLKLQKNGNSKLYFNIRYIKERIDKEGIKAFYKNRLKLKKDLGEIQNPSEVHYAFESFPIRGAIVYPFSYDYFIQGKKYSFRFTVFLLKCSQGTLIIESQSENIIDNKSPFVSSGSFKLIKKLKLYRDKLP